MHKNEHYTFKQRYVFIILCFTIFFETDYRFQQVMSETLSQGNVFHFTCFAK